jgi:signal transduction histidine kinase
LLFQDLKTHGYPDCEEASKITALINEAINKTRRLAQGLYPVEIKSAGLYAMLEQFTLNIEAIYKLESEFISEGKCNINDPHILINLFRITQEAVNNAVKHSEAAKITIRIVVTPSKLTLIVEDDGDGIGINTNTDLIKLEAKDGIGMHTMRYRASLLGATLGISRRQEGGTTVIVELPIE